MDRSLDEALTGESHPTPTREMPPAPPPLRAPPPGSPPRLPRRERRSAFTEEDRAFLDRTFASIADRKAELLAESQKLRRTPPRREAMGTPEGKIQILRDELKLREAQLARISEIWTVRERELLSVEDRLHEKDVELQGLKMQVDDLLRRFNEAQAAMIQKEREHGATVDDLLLQKFATEKDLIEVVASKEKDVAQLAATCRPGAGAGREGPGGGAGLAEIERLERAMGVATLEFEVKEQTLSSGLATMTGRAEVAERDLAETRAALERTTQERDSHDAENAAASPSWRRRWPRRPPSASRRCRRWTRGPRRARGGADRAEAEAAPPHQEHEQAEARAPRRCRVSSSGCSAPRPRGENLKARAGAPRQADDGPPRRARRADGGAGARAGPGARAARGRRGGDARAGAGEARAHRRAGGRARVDPRAPRGARERAERQGEEPHGKLAETTAALEAERSARARWRRSGAGSRRTLARTEDALATAQEQLAERAQQAQEFVRSSRRRTGSCAMPGRGDGAGGQAGRGGGGEARAGR
jgi:hypothetical protein